MPSHRATGAFFLIVTATGWAFGWSAMKVLIREWPPLFSRGVAGTAAALILAVIAVRAGEDLRVARAAIPRLLFAAFTNVFAWPLLGTRPSAGGVVALVLGLAGIAVLLGGNGAAMNAGQLVGVALALAAAVCFALGSTLNRTPLPIPRTASVMWQVGLGCLPMIPLGLVFESPRLDALTPAGLGALVYMTVIGMAVCYLTWFATPRHLPPAIASTGMLLVPLIGVLSAAVLFGEPLGWREGSAMVLTLGGVTLALRTA